MSEKSDVDFLLQSDRRTYLEQELGTDRWLPCYVIDDSPDEKRAWFAAVGARKLAKASLLHTSWDVEIGGALPSLVTHYQRATRTVFETVSRNRQFVPFVHVRDYHGIYPDTYELNEELRLFYNLYHDYRRSRVLHLDEDGEESEFATLHPKKVVADARLLKHFARISRSVIAIYFAFDRYSPISIDVIPQEQRRAKHIASDLCWTFHTDKVDWRPDFRSFSRLVGKKLIFPEAGPIEMAWKKKHQRYCSFLVAEADGRSTIEMSCHPDNFDSTVDGADPAAYLRTAFFRRDVLTKYHGNPSKYQVRDGIVQCGDLWSLPIDNNHSTHIVVLLGDLGGLRYEEQLYWRSYNVEPTGSVSDVQFKRSFLAVPTDPSSPDLVFKETFLALRIDWTRRYGWSLFLPLDASDSHAFESIRRSLTDSQSEFDQQILGLTKTLVDSINESALSRLESVSRESKGITKLEQGLLELGFSETASLVLFLRNLQGLRSSGAAHRKGTNYRKLSEKLELDDVHLGDAFTEILTKATEFLADLRTFCAHPKEAA